jgi:hypothetical protein
MVAPDMDVVGPVRVSGRRLWAGGAATAVVAALAVVAGVLVTRGVLGIPVIAPRAASNFGNSSTLSGVTRSAVRPADMPSPDRPVGAR